MIKLHWKREDESCLKSESLEAGQKEVKAKKIRFNAMHAEHGYLGVKLKE